MKLSKVIILSLGMALCAAGGIGTAVALTREGKTVTDTSNHFDKAICLYWSEDGSSVDLDDMDELTVGHSDYRKLTVAPKKSASLAGTVSVNFELEAQEAEGSVTKGITVNVYNLDSLPEGEVTEANAASVIGETPASVTINGSSSTLTGSTSFTVSVDVAAPVKYYLVEVSIGSASLALGEKVAANLSITQTFAE
jgi:hypothetical protein